MGAFSMQLQSETNGQDLFTFCDDLVGSDSTSYPIAKKVRAANEGDRIIWSAIFDAYGGWHYDDRNQTDLPEATATLTSGQTQYSLPLDSAHLLGVSFKNAGGVWAELTPITLEQIQDRAGSEAEFMKIAATPVYYRPLANGFKIYPAANFTQSASLKIWFSRDISSFAVTDTTKTPGFDQEFHELIGTYMALRYAKSNTLKVLAVLQSDWNEGLVRIKKHYSNRFRQMFPPHITVGDAAREFA
jgi:hypothetical protein